MSGLNSTSPWWSWESAAVPCWPCAASPKLTDRLALRLAGTSSDGIDSTRALVAFGLRLTGCDDNGLIATQKAAFAKDAPRSGAACTSAVPGGR